MAINLKQRYLELLFELVNDIFIHEDVILGHFGITK